MLFQSLLLQVSFKTTRRQSTTKPPSFNPFSFRSPSKHAGRTNYGPWYCFNPFSFRSPSKHALESLSQNDCFNPFSFRSPSKPRCCRRRDGLRGFNPFSFRSPSKRRQRHVVLRRCFNPFSFRSPSKRRTRHVRSCHGVSIPSPSGLLQNTHPVWVGLTLSFQSLLLQVSFKTLPHDCVVRINVSIPSPSGLLQNRNSDRQRLELRFNPFSFRSPSKRRSGISTSARRVSIPSPSGLLQNTPEPKDGIVLIVSIPSPSGLLQNWAGLTSSVRTRFNPFSFRSPSKPPRKQCQKTATFQSLLLQVSFKTRTLERLQHA